MDGFVRSPAKGKDLRSEEVATRIQLVGEPSGERAGKRRMDRHSQLPTDERIWAFSQGNDMRIGEANTLDKIYMSII